MPIFEYLCLACGHGFEKLQKSAGEEDPPCPACGSAQVKRQLSTFAPGATPAPHSGCSGGG